MSTTSSRPPSPVPSAREPAGRHRSADPRAAHRRSVRRTFLACLVLATAVTPGVTLGQTALGATSGEAAGEQSGIIVGAVGGVDELSRSSGAELATHAYSTFAKEPPVARMITVHAGAARFSEVAAARPGSRLYDDIVRWARVIKARGGHVMVAYNHEPEAAAGGQKGSASEFIAAWRRVVTIFRGQGADNVEWTWQMTDWAFRTAPSDQRYAAKWYPGDAYVDNIGADVYNWYDCGHGRGRWMELQALTDPVLAFARERGKRASLPEFAADPDPRRAQWLRNAHAYLVENRDVLTAVFYFNRGPTNPANQDCAWTLTTRAESDAYGAMARDSRFTA